MKSEAKSPFLIVVTLALVYVLALSLVSALAGVRPKRGGILIFVVASEPPGHDSQREATFGTTHPIDSFYSTLIRVNPRKIRLPSLACW